MKGRNRIVSILIIVCGISFSCEEVLEPSLETKKVVSLAPVDNLISVSTSQTFYWETLNGATKYQLQIVSPRFDSIVQLISDTTILTNQFPFSLSQGNYQWRVRAINNSTHSNYSDIRKMTIQ